MKKTVMALLMAAMVISLTACGQNAKQDGNTASDTSEREESTVPTGKSETEPAQPETDDTPEPSEDVTVTGTDGTEAADSQDVQEEEGSKVLVAYFSATGTTKGVAEIIAENMGADIYEIVPQKPYTDADLNWHDDSSRSTIEMNDRACRPEINGVVEGMEQYDIVFIGFPIWWYMAPRIINTFLESYDFSGKQIILFATSGGSGLGKTKDDLKASISKEATLMEGGLLNGKQTKESLKSWVERL